VADHYSTCPNDLFDDERLEGAPLATISGYAVLVLLADDHGLFDPNTRVLARRLGCGATEVRELLDALTERNMVHLYDVDTGDGRGVRSAAQIVGFHSYIGHPDRVKQPSQRGESIFPLPNGEKIMSRRARKKPSDDPPNEPSRGRAAGVQQSCSERAGGVQRPSKGRAANVQREGTNRNARTPESTAERSEAERSTAQHSAVPPAQHAAASRPQEQPTHGSPVPAPTPPGPEGPGSAHDGAVRREPQPVAEPPPDARPHDPVPAEREPYVEPYVTAPPPPPRVRPPTQGERMAAERVRVAELKAQWLAAGGGES
jgi:hypothetical protein